MRGLSYIHVILYETNEGMKGLCVRFDVSSYCDIRFVLGSNKSLLVTIVFTFVLSSRKEGDLALFAPSSQGAEKIVKTLNSQSLASVEVMCSSTRCVNPLDEQKGNYADVLPCRWHFLK